MIKALIIIVIKIETRKIERNCAGRKKDKRIQKSRERKKKKKDGYERGRKRKRDKAKRK